MYLQDILKIANSKLGESEYSCFKIYLKHLLKITDTDLVLAKDLIKLTIKQKIQLIKAINKLQKGFPIDYLLKSKFFWNNDFYINQSVLIPRQDSEVLIKAVLLELPNKNTNGDFLEIGVGSGCIILSLLQEYINVRSVALDVSKPALLVANKNAKNLLLSSRIRLVHGSIFKKIINKRYNLVVSNPPYIDRADFFIDPNVKKYEPKTALYAKKKGLIFYEKIFSMAEYNLRYKGKIIVEVGFQQSLDVIKLAESFKLVCINKYKDSSDIDRVLVFIRSLDV